MIKVICICLFVLSGTAAAQTDGAVLFSGRVIDEEGNPTSDAEVCLEPVVYESEAFDRIIECIKPGADGRFTMKKWRGGSKIETRYFLFVSRNSCESSLVRVTAPFDELRPAESFFDGMPFNLGSTPHIDAGDVPIKFYYGNAVLMLRKDGKNPIDWYGVYMKVSTKSGRTASFRSLSNSAIETHIRDEGTRLNICLPVGEWKVELVDGETEQKIASSNRFRIVRDRAAIVQMNRLP